MESAKLQYFNNLSFKTTDLSILIISSGHIMCKQLREAIIDADRGNKMRRLQVHICEDITQYLNCKNQAKMHIDFIVLFVNYDYDCLDQIRDLIETVLDPIYCLGRISLLKLENGVTRFEAIPQDIQFTKLAREFQLPFLKIDLLKKNVTKTVCKRILKLCSNARNFCI